jgi:hypothetical protein
LTQMASFLQWLEQTRFSTFLRESTLGEPIVESTHVLTLTLFLGFAVLLDLRLLGLCLMRRRMSEVLAQFNPYLAGGFAIMVITGTLLFVSDPVTFYPNTFLRVKMLMLILAGLNVLIFNTTIGRKVDEWDEAARTPRGAKIAGIVSLVLWAAIIAAGRAIAYTVPPPS